MRARSYRWLRARILALYNAPPIGWHDAPVPGKSGHTRHEPVWGTRLQQHMLTTSRR